MSADFSGGRSIPRKETRERHTHSSAPTAARSSQTTGTGPAGSAASHAVRPIDSGASAMRLNEDQFQRQMDYSATMHVLEDLRKQGLLSDSEFEKANSLMVEKYSPIIQPNC